MKLDVLILGGGAAGLAAARKLTVAGVNVLILEARARLGGRIHTLRDSLLPVPVEMGAEFVHGMPGETWEIIHAARLPAVELQMGDEFQNTHGRLRSVHDIFQQMQSKLKQLKNAKPGENFAQRMGREITARDEMAYAYVEGFDAAFPNDLSAKAIWDAEQQSHEEDGNRQFRFINGGYQAVVNWLHDACDPAHLRVKLNTPVRMIRWRRGRVEMDSGDRSYSAPQAIITLPLGMLKENTVKFDPPISEKREAIEGLAMGPVVKIILIFREPFWEAQDKFKNLSFIYSRHRHVPTWWTFLPVRTAALTGWAGGPAAARLSGKSPKRITALATEALAELTGWNLRMIRAQLLSAHVADWQSDIFSRGAYSYIKAGGEDAARILAEPIDHTLFFAGEATHTQGQSGTVAGALASGYRAAGEVLGDNCATTNPFAR